ncbi:helix-turn-helix domain-containing protein [Cohnella hashimotonis]|uniref:AraC family transcriptional regulator n=1 Tax=Cohnella hashimotonis TaxID=2826895 RepID=A0ABT6TEG3_9BACL|nr:AraC family transcriptional regulator [Cohnella hashimotonis]MDI4645210.1 AraC family transcriptional regulator [Cohnella hashimotonis]
MKPIFKPLHAAPEFPFSFVYRDTKTKQRELPDHLHDWYEMVYVHGGKGTFFIDRTFYDMYAGSLFLIPGNTIHRAFPDAEDPVTSTALFFNPSLVQVRPLGEPFSYLQCFDWSKQNRMYRLLCSPALTAGFEQVLLEIDEELRTSKMGARHAVSLLLQRILLSVDRELGTEGRGQTTQAPAIGPRWMRDALLFIDAHYADDIGLSELSKRASVSPAHFSRLFKQMTGMNVTGFIAAKRIVKAKEMLLATDHGVARIAAECGFESLPHFHRLFKRIAGGTPAAYRRRPSPE